MNKIKKLLSIVVDLITHFKALFETFLCTNPPKKWLGGKKGDVILVQGFGCYK